MCKMFKYLFPCHNYIVQTCDKEIPHLKTLLILYCTNYIIFFVVNFKIINVGKRKIELKAASNSIIN